ncbi:MAG: hypothetical protein AABX93_01900 [Nanoarchaeota archaeon]
MSFQIGIVKNLIFGFAIFIMTLFVGIYGISTLYGETPEYNKYCPENLINQSVCVSEGGTWTNNTQLVTDARGETKPVPLGGGYCSYDYTACTEEWDNAQEKYYKKVFLTALPLGIAIVVAGAMIFGLEIVGAGLMLGGTGIIVYGTGMYWRFTDDWMKFAISLAGLVILIGVAYWFNKNDWNIWKRKKRK